MPPRSRAAAAKTPAVAPLVLSGPPATIRGRTSLANGSDLRLVVRSGVLLLADRDPIEVPLSAVLPPGVEADVPVAIDLGRSTPPGTYTGILDVRGVRRPVEIHVDVVASLAVSPTTVLAPAGETKVSLRLRNEGNTALPLAVLTRGRLTPHDRSEDDGPDAELRLASALLLEPGADVVVAGRVVVPDGLDRTRRHRATLPIGPADLVVTVLPTDPKKPPAPRARAQSGRTPAPRTRRAPTKD